MRVRYHECDMQKVVFNANYWMYADDAVAQWMRAAIAAEKGAATGDVDLAGEGFDFMLKTASGTWHRGAVYGEVIDAACSVTRWGNTSFDVSVEMSVAGEAVFDCTITYVSTTPGAPRPVAVPAFVKRALEREF
ncbi:MAG: acyl-CoA thioesterase [Acidimicrobiales bacterium]